MKNKNYICHALYLRNSSIWSWFLVYWCKMMISPGVFFIFSKFWFTESIEGKMAKTTIQNDKKFCLLRSISQEPCIVWLSFMVLMFKMTISPDVFSVLHNFDLFGLSGGWNGQKSPEMTKNSVCCVLYFRKHISYLH